MLIEYDHFEGYLVRNQSAPVVILCPSWSGKDAYIMKYANWIASLGYTAFALDLYGKGQVGRTKQECLALKTPLLNDCALLEKRLLLGYAESAKFGTPSAVLGFGFGGLAALDLARLGVNLQAAISIYGHFELGDMSQCKAKMLLLHGKQDPIVPICELNFFETKLQKQHIPYETHLFDAMHAFTNPLANDASSGLQYNEVATKSAKAIIEAFLQENITS